MKNLGDSGSRFRTLFYYLLLTLLTLPFILPLIWMVLTSFQPAQIVYSSPPQLIPDSFTIENFSAALRFVDFTDYLLNTLGITLSVVAGTVISSSLVGYAFATLQGRGRQLLFGLLLASIMFPPTAALIPLFIGFSRLGWIDTYIPLVLPHFFANAFYVFLFHQYYRSLPCELFESAEIDGSNPLSTYLWIALPLSRPALAAVAVFAFIASWNDFLAPLIFINSNSKFTISLGLAMFQGTYYTQLHHLMPLSFLAVLPIILIFLLAQRYLIQGISMAGVKG